MSGSNHTPGPWHMARMERPPIGRQPNGEPWPTDANGNVFWGYSISGSSEKGGHILPTLAAVHNFPDQVEANARLIAAAPKLKDALAAMLDFWGGYECPEVDTAIAVMQEIGEDRWSMQARMEADALALPLHEGSGE